MNLKPATVTLLTATATLSGCYMKTEHHITLDHNINVNLSPIKIDNHHTFENNSTANARIKVAELIKKQPIITNEQKIQNR